MARGLGARDLGRGERNLDLGAVLVVGLDVDFSGGFEGGEWGRDLDSPPSCLRDDSLELTRTICAHLGAALPVSPSEVEVGGERFAPNRQRTSNVDPIDRDVEREAAALRALQSLSGSKRMSRRRLSFSACETLNA